MSFNVIILAAGQSSRFVSAVPKMMHLLAGKPLLQHVLDTVTALHPTQLIIVHHPQHTMLQTTFNQYPITWVTQSVPRGTGDAVKIALSALTNDYPIIVLYADVPLISQSTLKKLLHEATNHSVALITAIVEHPGRYGRVIRDAQGYVSGIIEPKDATPEQLAITEINAGIYCLPPSRLKQWLPQLSANNASGEYYLTDIIRLAVGDQVPIQTVAPAHALEITGVNTRAELARLERGYQQLQAERLMAQGVSIIDPARLDVRGQCDIAADVTIDVNVILEGHIKIGRGTIIGAHVVLRDVVIGEDVWIKPFSHIEGATIADHCHVGPFARLRTGTQLSPHVRVGNFVEIKQSQLGDFTKVNHLSYLGDATVGQHVNVGAGVITCNYDGAHKHPTVIEDHAFIGSNVALIAPIVVGTAATIAAGSTINRHAPSSQLTIARSKQRSVAAWKRPRKTEE